MAAKLSMEQIHTAALGVYARYGFKRTRVEDIARELGVVPGTLYRYVRDKRDLYEKAVAFGFVRWQDRVKASVEGADTVTEQFILLCEKSHQYLTNDPDMHQILMDDPSIFPLSPRKVRFPGIDNTSLDLIQMLLKKGMDQGVFRKMDLEKTTGFLYSVYVMFIIKTYVKSEGDDSFGLYETGIDLILNGLLKTGNGK